MLWLNPRDLAHIQHRFLFSKSHFLHLKPHQSQLLALHCDPIRLAPQDAEVLAVQVRSLSRVLSTPLAELIQYILAIERVRHWDCCRL